MIAISLDASTTCIGYSIWDNDTLIDYGKIKPDKIKKELNDETEEWRYRIANLMPKIDKIINKYKPIKAFIEEVPLEDGKGKDTLVKLGAVGGALYMLFDKYNISTTYITPNTWRSKVGIYDGTMAGKKRENLKPNGIKIVNRTFGLNLACEYTKAGKYSESKSDDDISDSMLIYMSTRDKYNIKPKSFGRK